VDEHRDGGEAGADGGVPAELAFGDGELAGLAAAAPDGDGLDAAGASGGIGERAEAARVEAEAWGEVAEAKGLDGETTGLAGWKVIRHVALRGRRDGVGGCDVR